MQDDLRRGDLVVCVLAGSYGKPRPAVVVQSDLFSSIHASVVVCPITSDLTGLSLFRIPLSSSETIGLRSDSEVMVDKLTAIERSKVGKRIGHLNRALRVWLDLPEG